MNLFRNSIIFFLLCIHSFALTMSGEVYDENLDPVTGATVLFDGTTVARTDHRGVYEVKNVKPASYMITFAAPGFQKYSERIDISEENSRFDLILTRGTVLQDDRMFTGKAVLNCPATALGGSGGIMLPDIRTVPNGKFVFSMNLMRIEHEVVNNAIVESLREDVSSVSLSYGILDNLEIGGTVADRLVLNADNESPTEFIFNAKYRLENFDYYVPLAVGMKVSSFENYYYIAGQAYSDDWQEHTIIFENTRDSDQYWVHILSEMRIPKLHVDFMDYTNNTFIFEIERLNRKDKTLNFGLRFSKEIYSLMLFYQRDNTVDKNHYGIGASMLF